MGSEMCIRDRHLQGRVHHAFDRACAVYVLMYYASSLTCVWANSPFARLFRLARPRGAPMLFGRCVLVYSCSLGNTAQTERPGSAKRRGEIAGKAVVARILETIKHRLKHRPALVAGVIVGAVAVLTIGACAMAASAVRPEDPVAVADEVVAALPEATAQTGQAAASQAQSGDVVDPRAVAEDARTALDLSLIHI